MQALVEHNVVVGLPAIQSARKCPSAGWRCPKPGQQRHKKGGGRRWTRCQAKKAWNPTPEVDTRIHWSSPDEGWIGSSSRDESSPESEARTRSSILDDILNTFNEPLDSHYAFLGIEPNTDIEGVKAAYRKLSKLYHPDTTSLPPEDAAVKFLRLQKAYDVLSSVEERQIYDWALAQEMSNREGGGFVWPYEAQKTLQGPGFQTKVVGKSNEKDYIDLSGQMLAGLFFDGFAVLFSILVILYVAVFKQH
ncbi:hypothetical protein KP509_36G046300 [Ceratopteris richardii]|uniref:J domain-containing protein n=1 Tax=Ceratopteris richardii TaxID=49495 RepID=A0A8T2QC42_CERRI|nr:hypothetical protein KP509_36G046300 [Ceratopteris richardii]